MRTWKILQDNRIESDVKKPIVLTCTHCGQEASVETHGFGPLVIATFGMRMVFDNPQEEPPQGWLPDVIQCRQCHYIYDGRQE